MTSLADLPSARALLIKALFTLWGRRTSIVSLFFGSRGLLIVAPDGSRMIHPDFAYRQFNRVRMQAKSCPDKSLILMHRRQASGACCGLLLSPPKIRGARTSDPTRDSRSRTRRLP